MDAAHGLAIIFEERRGPIGQLVSYAYHSRPLGVWEDPKSNKMNTKTKRKEKVK